MSLFGNFKNLIGIKPDDLDVETSDTISILKEENRVLKERMNNLMKENELLRQSVFNNNVDSSSKTQFGKIFSGLKTAFLSGESLTGVNQSVTDFKTFLFQNMLYNDENIEEDDIEYLNNINITDDDWNKNKDLYIFKQKLLSKNYQELIRNVLISNELNEFYKDSKQNRNESINKEAKASGSTTQSSKQADGTANKIFENLLLQDSFKDYSRSSLSTPKINEKSEAVKVTNIKINTKADNNSSNVYVDNIQINKTRETNTSKEKVNKSELAHDSLNVKTAAIETNKDVKDKVSINKVEVKLPQVDIEEEEENEFAKIATKKIIPPQNKTSSNSKPNDSASSNILNLLIPSNELQDTNSKTTSNKDLITTQPSDRKKAVTIDLFKSNNILTKALLNEETSVENKKKSNIASWDEPEEDDFSFNKLTTPKNPTKQESNKTPVLLNRANTTNTNTNGTTQKKNIWECEEDEDIEF
jgi:hypothetical protein